MNTELKTEIVSHSAIESISRAEIDVAISTARKFPRHLPAVKQKMLSFATLDQETAESCFYTLPRGGKNIQGPSVRLAEIAVSTYGNLRAGARIIETVTEGPNPHVTIQAVAMDLENNTQVSIEKRRRITKKKSKDTIDEDDINLAANAGSAIAFRDAVFKVVPMALIKPVYEQAKKVAIGDTKTLGDRRVRCAETFGKMGISKERLLAKLEKKHIDDITLEDVETMIGLHNAIRDGEVSIDEAFPEAKAAPVFAKKPTAPEPKPEEVPMDFPRPPSPQSEGVATTQASAESADPALADLAEAMNQNGVTLPMLMTFAKARGLLKGEAAETLADIRADKLASLAKNIRAQGGILKQIKGEA